ncbi:MAG: hypothetical protein HUJ86_08025, partial [Synergistes sp.]|nr:hypothetical protein [Synergistes sp.]
RKLADFSQTIDIKEPELPENLDYEDFNKFSHYLQRLSRRQSVQIEDCPFSLDVERTKKILKRNPNAFIDRETATSGYKLSKWLREQEAESTHRRSTAHRKRRYYRK